jgi:hydrogenase expression/formation protein HypD
MKYLDEFRDADLARDCLGRIHALARRACSIMEVCGGQTHSIIRYGIDRILPSSIRLLHGPGCPVCVTPIEQIDKAVVLASRPDVIFCSFGDMLRVPGSQKDLFWAKACGGDVRIVFSPMDALEIARQNPEKEVVFFAVGFETTAPAHALTVFQAHQSGIANFSILASLVLVPPALRAILASPDCEIDGFLAAGHVCAVMGYRQYEPIAQEYNVPIVVTGFEPVDILQGILMCVKQLQTGKACVENQYSRAVSRNGNAPAQKIMNEVFEIIPRNWRGIGIIPLSGLGLRSDYSAFDAEVRFSLKGIHGEAAEACWSGLILRGVKRPDECPEFGLRCAPEHPLGATMVSSEGACAAYYRYRGSKEPSES